MRGEGLLAPVLYCKKEELAVETVKSLLAGADFSAA